MTIKILLLAGVCATAINCAPTPSSAPAPTPADAKAFLADANATTLKLGSQQGQSGWVQQTFITDDTEAISARANQAANDAGARFAKASTKYDAVQVSADERRQLTLLKVANVLASPADEKESDELSKIMARLESTYGKGKWCTDASKPDTCKNIDEVSRILSTPGDEKALRAAWEGWHTIAPPMRKDYQRFVELSNKGARELGFADTGERGHRTGGEVRADHGGDFKDSPVGRAQSFQPGRQKRLDRRWDGDGVDIDGQAPAPRFCDQNAVVHQHPDQFPDEQRIASRRRRQPAQQFFG